MLVDRSEPRDVERALRELPWKSPTCRQVGLVGAEQPLDRPFVPGEEQIDACRCARGCEAQRLRRLVRTGRRPRRDQRDRLVSQLPQRAREHVRDRPDRADHADAPGLGHAARVRPITQGRSGVLRPPPIRTSSAPRTATGRSRPRPAPRRRPPARRRDDPRRRVALLRGCARAARPEDDPQARQGSARASGRCWATASSIRTRSPLWTSSAGCSAGKRARPG